MQGCKNDDIISASQQVGDDESVIMIRTRAGSALSPEEEIHSLRLFVFAQQADGTYTLALNKLFNTSEATSSASGLPSGFVEYFIKNTDTGNYNIAKILKKNTIRVLVVANELNPLDKITTIEDVQKTTLDFFKTYGSGTMDIKIDNNGPGSKGYIPMYTETEPITPYEWDGLSGKVITLDLVRTLAKVTLQITGFDVSGDPLATNGTISINSVSVMRVSQSELLGVPSEYEGGFVNTAIQKFDIPVTSTNTSSNQLTFYIPEYIVSEANKDDGLYSYLQLNAVYKANTDGKESVSTYKILLGNGMKDIYSKGTPVLNLDAVIAGCTKEDLTVSRNKSYNYDVKVSTTGALAVMKVLVGITDWTEQNINGDIDRPCLSLSRISWTYDYAITEKNRIYFWTNVKDLTFEPIVKHSSQGDLSIDDVFSKHEITLFKNNDLTYPYNGYIDFVAKNNMTAGDVIVATINAGGLKRNISIHM